MKPTIEELQEIKNDEDKERTRVNLTLSLNLCPECGTILTVERFEKFHKPESYLFGLIKIYGKMWDMRVVCPNDVNHYETKENYDFTW